MAFPQQRLDDIPKVEVTQIVTDLRTLNAMGRPKTNDELRDRLNQYFTLCQTTSIRPGIESMCLGLHITRETLRLWCNGIDCDKERQEIAQTAKAFVIAYIEQATLSARLNPASSCFLLKNWAHYRDQIDISADRQTQDQRNNVDSVETIKARHNSIGSTEDTLTVDDIRPD